MSFWGKIFGTEKALNSVVEGVTSGLDALVYTDEEKATDAANDRKQARQAVIDWMTATQGQNLARRVIALTVTAMWTLQYLLSMTGSMIAVWGLTILKNG